MPSYEQLKRRAFCIVGQNVIRCSVPACPIRALDMLHLDHINNNGCDHRRRHNGAGGANTYRWVNPAEARESLQILCANHDRMKQRYGSIDRIVEIEEAATNEEFE